MNATLELYNLIPNLLHFNNVNLGKKIWAVLRLPDRAFYSNSFKI